MARHRHEMQKKAKGGRVEYNAQGSNVMKEAHEKKDGGKVHGKKGKHRFDKKARGGGVHASGKDMTKSPFSAAHTGGKKAHNPPAHARGGHAGK